MPTSRRLWAWVLLSALIGAVGCARVAARPPESNPAAAMSTPAGSAQPQHPLDPSEEITPGELASIPEPVPAGQSGSSAPARQRLPEAPERPSALRVVQTPDQPPEAAQPPSAGPAAGDNGGSRQAVWRVQVFASQDLQLADRKGKEAAERLQVRAYLEFEAPYYKVRLGDFATEEEAQALREQAILAGYPGAFRTRCSPDITQDGQ